MSRREKFLDTMRRKCEGYVPFELELCPSKLDELEAQTGTRDYMAYFNVPFRWVSPRSLVNKDRYRGHYCDDDSIGLDDWGVGYKTGSVAHFTHMQHPMERFGTLEEFESYPYPDAEKGYDWSGVPADVAALRARDLIVMAPLQTTIFEMAWYLRGMENFMADMVLEPEIAGYHMDRITAVREETARRYAETGCDVLSLGDDVATQLDMMISPVLWRTHLKPRLQKVINAAKKANPSILVAYHSDGNITKIIPELIEIGVDILNPLQPECMDVAALKRQYGNRLSFWGALGTQTTFPFGSPEDVRNTCRELIERVGKGGGFLLAPTHVIEPEVPWANVDAFLDEVNSYNARSHCLGSLER